MAPEPPHGRIKYQYSMTSQYLLSILQITFNLSKLKVLYKGPGQPRSRSDDVGRMLYNNNFDMHFTL